MLEICDISRYTWKVHTTLTSCSDFTANNCTVFATFLDTVTQSAVSTIATFSSLKMNKYFILCTLVITLTEYTLIKCLNEDGDSIFYIFSGI